MSYDHLDQPVSRRTLLIALVVACLHGLVYVFLVPPWQHADEPNHFEYVWLVARRGVIPQAGDYDQGMRREVAQSMLEHGFFRGLNFTPDLEAESQPIWIGGYSQLSNPPLYYLAAAAPLRLLPAPTVTQQLYLARLVSLLFLLATVAAAWGIVAELARPGHPLRLLVPLGLALLPGFIDLMTSVNNDAGAIALFSLSLWGSLRILRRGPALRPALLTLLVVGLSFFMKETAFIALPVFGFALLFAALTGRRRRFAWAVCLLGLAAGALAAVRWGDAALWYRSTGQATDTRAASEQAPLGEHVFRVESGAEVSPSWLVPLFQPVPALTGQDIQERTYTLGAWMWASAPVVARTPILNDGKQAYFAAVTLGTEPAFYALKAKLPPGPVHRVWVTLSPLPPDPEQNVVVYYDSLVLAEGERPALAPPEFQDRDGRQGRWGGADFTNLLRNASAERAGPRLAPWLDHFGVKLLPDQTRPSLVATYLLDWRGAYAYYRAAADRLFRSFWGLFGWAHVPLKGFRPYHFLLAATLAGVLGAGLALWRQRRALAPETLLLLAGVLALVWGTTFVRGAVYLAIPSVYYPVARYAYTAIIPTVLVLCLGWLELAGMLERRLKLPAWLPPGSLVVGLLLLDLLAIYSIVQFYYRG